MSGTSQSISFDDYSDPHQGMGRLYSNTHAVQLAPLDGDTGPRRTAPQSEPLERVTEPFSAALPGRDSPFGASLDWPYRGYLVMPLSQPERAEGRAGSTLGDWPDQPVPEPVKAERSEMGGSAEQARRLCLFNVIVALEWHPDDEYLQRLRWAFRRASDFLYDVTDGSMAFGQVVFAGPELLECADIQIMASNRLLPRSWVDGLHEPTKYQPIRVGRGYWNKVTRLTITWDEPEAYRSLIHEWGHYALALTDDYLSSVPVSPGAGAGLAAAPLLVGAGHTVVVPEISLPIQSIMAIQQGTSELTALRGLGARGRQSPRHGGEWEKLAQKPQFSFLQLDQYPHPQSGPGRLPLPLPYFHNLLQASRSEARQAEHMPLTVPAGIESEHCWVYVVKGELGAPSNVIAQGTLEARSADDGFPLLGAVAGDVVVLIGKAQGRPGVRVKWSRLDGDGATTPTDITEWNDATPDAFPLIDVLPQAVEDPRAPVAVKVRVTSTEGPLPNWIIALPAGIGEQDDRVQSIEVRSDGASTWESEALDVGAMDGYVLAGWNDGPKLAICAFSSGGGPDSGYAVPDNPTSGGSSEGNAMLFFEDKDRSGNYRDLRVVTTVLLGVPDQLRQLPDDSQARSYTFSLAANGPLPTEFNPTLILYYDSLATHEEGDLRIYRHSDDNRWMALPTYLKPGTSIAAVPLADESAGGSLLAADEPRVERYRLYWTRRDGW